MACAWAMLHESVCDEDCTLKRGPPRTWLNTWLAAREANFVPSASEIYNLALYWSVMTLTSIG